MAMSEMKEMITIRLEQKISREAVNSQFKEVVQMVMSNVKNI